MAMSLSERRWRDQDRKKRNVREAQRVKERPCARCGESHPYYVMHLDHREGEQKAKKLQRRDARGNIQHPMSVTKLARSSPRKFFWESQKCDVICANCHAYVTHERGDGNRRHLPGEEVELTNQLGMSFED
jgi:hypothetical protein